MLASAGGFAFSPVTRRDGREIASCLKQLAPGGHGIPAPQVLEAVPGAAAKPLIHIFHLSFKILFLIPDLLNGIK